MQGNHHKEGALDAQKYPNSAMKSSSSFIPLAFAFVLLSLSPLWAVPFDKYENFLQCLSRHSSGSDSISDHVYTPINSTYSSVLNFSIRNLRFSTARTPKPLIIITPSHVSHVQAAVICSRTHGLQVRTRSGGHDFEGLSYVSHLPFIIIDLINLKSVTIDVKDKTAWVQSGATLGELYYKIAEKSRTLGFPAGICPTVGVGGHFSGGGYGMMLRKYGLAADNVIDAYLVDANGKFHDKKSMGEDVFWAIRGGGGGSFGIVVAWKVKLVPVPATVTVCMSNRTLEQGVIKLIHKWQYVANKLDDNLFLGILLTGMNSTDGGERIPTASFFSLFLGKIDQLVAILQTAFPELGSIKNECLETSWIESTLILAGFPIGEPLETLLNRIPTVNNGSIKIKSDFVKESISEAVIEGIWKRLKSRDIQLASLIFVPYGGRMSEISESETPYSHRAGNLYKIGYILGWDDTGIEAEKRHLNWAREIYDYMTPFVSKLPRSAYVNYRDLDLGKNNKYDKTSYEQASVWGLKYFGNNFNRLVHIKTKIDPDDFFRHEQSIPTLAPT